MTTETQDTLTTGSGPLAPTEPTASTADGQVGTVYVIQQQEQLGNHAWVDAGRVTVPKRSSLKTVFDTALEELQELRPTEAAPVTLLRALQPEDIAEWEAVFEKPPAPPAQVVVRPRAS